MFVFHPQSDSLQVSFHLPLHRYLSVFMCQAIKHQGLSLKDVLPPRDVLMLSMMHPLRVQVGPRTFLYVSAGLQKYICPFIMLSGGKCGVQNVCMKRSKGLMIHALIGWWIKLEFLEPCMSVYRVGWFGALLLVLVQSALSMKEYLNSFHTSLYLNKLLYFRA